MRINEWVKYIKCPQCFSIDLLTEKEQIKCNQCNHKIHLKNNGLIIDLLPLYPPAFNYVSSDIIEEYYTKQYETDFFDVTPQRGWGGKGANKGHNVFVEEERKLINNIISSMKIRDLLIDLTGGSGFYSFYFAKFFKKVIHCDISIEALESAYEEALSRQLQNVYFARCDFRKIPFQQELASAVILIDSLEYYGVQDDRKTIQSIIDVLQPSGSLVFDIHLKRWFKRNKQLYEYSLKDKKELLMFNNQVIKTNLISLGRWPMRFCTNRFLWKISNSFFFKFIPPTRNVISCQKIASGVRQQARNKD